MAWAHGQRVFQVAFVSSLAVHTLLIARWSGLAGSPTRPQPPPSQRLVLAPVTPPPSPAVPLPQPSVRTERPSEALPATGTERQVNIVERAQRPTVQPLIPEVTWPRERLDKPAVPAVIDLSNLSVELETNPGYLDYFRTIRERIRYQAQRNYPRASRSGEVFLSFVLSASGYLQSAQVDAARSGADTTLHQASLRSVQQAAPFPPFPAAFNQPQITFHIIIEYEAAP